MSCCKTYDPCLDSKLNQIGSYASVARQSAEASSASATQSATSATSAAASATAAAASETNVENIWEDFQDRYMGPFASPPVAPGEGSMYYNTVSNVLFVWNGSAWVSADFNEFTNFTATGTTFARNLVTREADVVNVKDFGAVGDGVADDYISFRNALLASQNKQLYIPSGTYKILIPDGAVAMFIGENTKIIGDGFSSFLNFETTGTSYINALRLNNGVSFEDLKIKFTVKPSQVASLFIWGQSVSYKNNRFTNCELFSSHSILDTSQQTYLFNTPSNAGSAILDFTLENCIIHNWFYTYLKTISSVCTERRWKIIGNYFYDNSEGHWSINSPSGIHDDVLIEGNSFGSTTSSFSGLVAMIGLASATNVKIIGNSFIGVTAGEAIHIEEKSDNFIIQGNNILVGELTDQLVWGDGIRILDNNIGGNPRKAPSRFVISGNTITRIGSKGGVGIAFQFDMHAPNAEYAICTNNIIENFDIGILGDGVDNTIRVTNNLIKSCNNGIRIPGNGNLQFVENTCIDCSNGYLGSGFIGGGHFIDCATPIDADPSGRLETAEWSLQINAITLNASTTTTLIINKAGLRFNGNLTCSLGLGASRTVFLLGVNYDGVTLTSSVLNQYNPSTISFNALSVSGSDIVLTISNSGAQINNAILRIDFNGLHVFA